MALILNGKDVAQELTSQLIIETAKLKGKGIIPSLSIVRLGANDNDLAYEKGAKGRCKKIGIDVNVIELDEATTENELITVLEKLNDDNQVHGILVFRPLPKHINEDIIKNHIKPCKDVDCFNTKTSSYKPCTAEAVMEILKFYNIQIQGKKAVVLGRSEVIGRPVANMLLDKNATITICHSKTQYMAAETSQADILVSAMGIPNMIKARHIKKNVVLIDVGINTDDNGNLCGDIDFNSILTKAGAITPVPGGVGAVTTTILAKHILETLV